MKKPSNAESIVLDVLWQDENPLTSNQVQERCRELGYVWEITTIMTYLAHLVDKHLVEFTVQGKSRYYTPRYTQGEYKSELLRFNLIEKMRMTPEDIFVTLAGEELTEHHINEMKKYLEKYKK